MQEADARVNAPPLFSPDEWAAQELGSAEREQNKKSLFDYASTGPKTTLSKGVNECIKEYVEGRLNKGDQELLFVPRPTEKNRGRFNRKFEKYSQDYKNLDNDATPFETWLTFAGAFGGMTYTLNMQILLRLEYFQRMVCTSTRKL
jgi:hypothetical protein